MTVKLAVGDKAPDFKLATDGGGDISLADLAGRKVVLYFYPKADTPGCTKEAIAFSSLKKAFSKADTEVIGVSADEIKAQDKFKSKHKLTTVLASDPAHEMLTAYGVWGKKTLYGRLFDGITRTTVLIGRDGRILRVWPKVKVDGHADEVLAAAQEA